MLFRVALEPTQDEGALGHDLQAARTSVVEHGGGHGTADATALVARLHFGVQQRDPAIRQPIGDERGKGVIALQGGLIALPLGHVSQLQLRPISRPSAAHRASRKVSYRPGNMAAGSA